MNKRCATLFYPLRNTVARYFDLPAMRSTAGQVMQKTTTYTAYYFSHHAAPRPNNAATIHNVYMASKKYCAHSALRRAFAISGSVCLSVLPGHLLGHLPGHI